MLLALFAASGGNWMALQSVAWTRMLLTYSQGGHFATAVAKTFDGRHPCELCKKIERARKSEHRSDGAVQQESLASFIAPSVVALFKAEGTSWKMEIPVESADARCDQPAFPPPRSAAA